MAAEINLASIDVGEKEKKTAKLADRLQAEEKEAQHWQERVQKLQAQLSALDFQFKNPDSGVDRSRVTSSETELAQETSLDQKRETVLWHAGN